MTKVVLELRNNVLRRELSGDHTPAVTLKVTNTTNDVTEDQSVDAIIRDLTKLETTAGQATTSLGRKR